MSEFIRAFSDDDLDDDVVNADELKRAYAHIKELEQLNKHWKDKWQQQTFEYIELKNRANKLEALKQKADEMAHEYKTVGVRVHDYGIKAREYLEASKGL